MGHPWDRPPIPKRGDEHEDITYTHVGKIITRWESIEFELSRLYTWLGGSLHDQALMREYGACSIFRERAKTLERKAEAFFANHPNQRREGEFHELLRQAKGYVNRRSDIAHGILFRIDPITYFRERIKPQLLKREHYAIILPLYAYRFATPQGFPDFAYTSVEMRRLGQRLWNLQKAFEAWRLAG